MTRELNRNVRNEAFTSSFLRRIPLDVSDTFTDMQLIAISDAMQFQSSKLHPLDFRGTVTIWNKPFYFAALGGVDHRYLTRAQKSVIQFEEVLVFLSFTVISIVIGIVGLYLTKYALGIDF